MSDTDTRLGKALRDALQFLDIAAGEGLMFQHDAGYWLHADDICTEFAKAAGVELGSPEYFEAIKGLARLPSDKSNCAAE